MEKKKFDAKLNSSINIKDISLARYIGCIPQIFVYQVITKLFLLCVSSVLKALASLVVNASSEFVITNSDIPYLFTSFRGVIVILIGLFILIIYTIMDINCMILIADNFLHQKNRNIFEILADSLLSIKYMIHPKGILVLLFVSVIAPLTVSFYGISLTKSFYIPDFIMSVIDNTTLYRIPYYLCMIIFSLLGFIYLFTMHFMVLRKVNISEAMHTSRVTMAKYYKNFIKRYGLFLIKSAIVVFITVLIFMILPTILYYNHAAGHYNRFWLSLIGFQSLVMMYVIKGVFGPFQFMELNRIYESYTFEDEGELIPPKREWHIRFWLGVCVVYLCIISVSAATINDEAFNFLYPTYHVSEVIAHRAGGNLANENTLLGLDAAIQKGVDGSEIDVQRTKDGHYIVYHDNNFSRLCGVRDNVSDLTLQQCKQLDVINSFSLTGNTTKLATAEEMLDTAKGKIHLFIELKGVSADDKMAEDIYQMIIERDMVNEVTVISLKYDVINHLEKNHPEIDTGYLCYVSLSKVANLNCDNLLLEDEMATEKVIDEAHYAGKKVYIWTVNSDFTMKRRMTDNSDGVITDDVDLANIMHELLEKRSDFTRVLDYFLTYL